jgi:hypothetical protein
MQKRLHGRRRDARTLKKLSSKKMKRSLAYECNNMKKLK